MNLEIFLETFQMIQTVLLPAHHQPQLLIQLIQIYWLVILFQTDRAFNYCSTTGGAASNNPGELIIFAERINDTACTITYNPANGTTALAGCY